MTDAEKALLLALRASLKNAKEDITSAQRAVMADVLYLLFVGRFAKDSEFMRAIDLILLLEDSGLNTISTLGGKYVMASAELAALREDIDNLQPQN